MKAKDAVGGECEILAITAKRDWRWLWLKRGRRHVYRGWVKSIAWDRNGGSDIVIQGRHVSRENANVMVSREEPGRIG